MLVFAIVPVPVLFRVRILDRATADLEDSVHGGLPRRQIRAPTRPPDRLTAALVLQQREVRQRLAKKIALIAAENEPRTGF